MAAPCKNSGFGGLAKHCWKGSAGPHGPAASWREVRGKARAHQGWGVCRDHPAVPPPLQEGDYFGGEGRKEPIIPPPWGNPCTRTHTRTQGRHTQVAGSLPLDMLTCRQATPLPCKKGRCRRKGHGGGQLKREAVGRGIEAPGGESRAKTKRKDGGWSLKTEQKIVNSIQGRGWRGSHQHTACSTHRGKVLSTPCPLWGSHLS